MNTYKTETINQYLNEYYGNDCKKLYKVVNDILKKLKFHDVDVDDFCSLAGEVITKAIPNYDFEQDFDGYIYRCLENKFKTEMTRRTRDKRCVKVRVEVKDNNNNTTTKIKIIKDDSLDRVISSPHNHVGNNTETTLGDTLTDKKTVENIYFEDKEEGYSKEMKQYLGRLSNLQKEVLRLISIGYMPSEIVEELHINQKLYNDCYNAIHSYKNILILM